MPMHNESYASGGYGGGKSGGAHGPGGLNAAMKRNPNSSAMLNDTPYGPSSHLMGYSGDGGIMGDQSVDHRGSTFWFK